MTRSPHPSPSASKAASEEVRVTVKVWPHGDHPGGTIEFSVPPFPDGVAVIERLVPVVPPGTWTARTTKRK